MVAGSVGIVNKLQKREDEVEQYEDKSVCSRTGADKLLFCNK